MSEHPANEQLTEEIRQHYDALCSVSHLLWGPYVHHGYWEDGDETPAQAQVKLIERLAEQLHVTAGLHVLDIGSGLGGASCWLAKTFGCSVLGLTFTATQAKTATKRAEEQTVDDRVHFKVYDADNLDLPSESFDRVWIVECSEHVRDKQAFFRHCARVLRPGGRLGLCARLKGDTSNPAHEELLQEICRVTLCPSLLTMSEQVAMLETAGLVEIEARDVAANVMPTWTRCRRLVDNPLVQLLVRTKAGKLRRFVDSVELMERGYGEGAMAYGMVTATRAQPVSMD